MDRPEGCLCTNKHNPNCPVHSTEEDQARQRAAFDRAFAMTPEELGKAAVEEAQRNQRIPDCPECRPGFPCSDHEGSF